MTSEECYDLRVRFSAPYLRSIARQGIDSSDLRFVNRMGATTLREMFSTAYLNMRRNYPVEYVLKNELLLWARAQFPESYIETEYWMLDTRADLIVITKDRSIVYEIKTRYDSHQRIKSQIESYSKVFGEIILVTEEGYSFRYHKHVPSYVGLMSITAKGELQEIISATKQTRHLNIQSMWQRMHKAELIAFGKRVYPEKKYVPTYYYQYYQDIIKDMTAEEMQSHMQLHWSRRESIRYLDFLPQLPECLTTAMYDYRLLKREWKSIIEILDEPIDSLIGE